LVKEIAFSLSELNKKEIDRIMKSKNIICLDKLVRRGFKSLIIFIILMNSDATKIRKDTLEVAFSQNTEDN